MLREHNTNFIKYKINEILKVIKSMSFQEFPLFGSEFWWSRNNVVLWDLLWGFLIQAVNGLLPVHNRLMHVGEGVFQINWDYFLKLEKIALKLEFEHHAFNFLWDFEYSSFVFPCLGCILELCDPKRCLSVILSSFKWSLNIGLFLNSIISLFCLKWSFDIVPFIVSQTSGN